MTPLAIDPTHRLQAAAFLKRWRSRAFPARSPEAGTGVPDRVEMPPEVRTHYRHFSWVIHEQRLVVAVGGVLFAACVAVWGLAWHLGRKPPVVVRARPSLKEEAAAFYGGPEISYDSLSFFLNGTLALLHSNDDSGHPLLPLAQGAVAPDVYNDAERRLDGAGPDVQAHRMTQTLTVTGIGDVVADAKSGRAAAYVRGYVTVTMHRSEAHFFPWRARVLVAIHPASRLNPYPFFLLRCEERMGPDAATWDSNHENFGMAPP